MQVFLNNFIRFIHFDNERGKEKKGFIKFDERTAFCGKYRSSAEEGLAQYCRGIRLFGRFGLILLGFKTLLSCRNVGAWERGQSRLRAKKQSLCTQKSPVDKILEMRYTSLGREEEINRQGFFKSRSANNEA